MTIHHYSCIPWMFCESRVYCEQISRAFPLSSHTCSSRRPRRRTTAPGTARRAWMP